ncbi:hypothetical protein HanPSC8_Chr01g0024061 [Helianthus annuus]|nr:hypothetical protein HanPSC8_Chr01g0024061 [Helianthus annuus]
MICLNPVFKAIFPPIVFFNTHQFRGFLSGSSLIFQVHSLSNRGWSSRCSKGVVKLRIHDDLTRFSRQLTEKRSKEFLKSDPVN